MTDIILSMRPYLLDNIVDGSLHCENIDVIKSYKLTVTLKILRRGKYFIITRTNKFTFSDGSIITNVSAFILLKKGSRYIEYKVYVPEHIDALEYISSHLKTLEYTMMERLYRCSYRKIEYFSNDLLVQSYPSIITI